MGVATSTQTASSYSGAMDDRTPYQGTDGWIRSVSYSSDYLASEPTQQRGKYGEIISFREPVTYSPDPAHNTTSSYSGSLFSAYDMTRPRGPYGELMAAPTPPLERKLPHNISSEHLPYEPCLLPLRPPTHANIAANPFENRKSYVWGLPSPLISKPCRVR